MSWMSTLYKTYESNARMAGVSGQTRVPLTPIAHIAANAQLEITVDTDGEFVRATEVPKDNSKTIVPVTESSAGRANAVAPHALCDNLSYVAGDFTNYSDDKKYAETAVKKYKAYMDDLNKWNNSSYTTMKVSAIYKYLSKGLVINDLVASGLVKTENGKFADKKINGAPPDKTFVRFRVLGTNPDASWLDPMMFKCYTDYYLSNQSGRKDICYITGTEQTISGNHPKGIIAANYGAKLISANDNANYTFRGRFTTSEEACAVSYEASQKAHAALTWLAGNQGVTIGTKDKRTYICWNPDGKEVARLDDPMALEDDTKPVAQTEPEYRKYLSETLNGYRNMLQKSDSIAVIGLDAATTGRLSITYYNELTNSDFYDRIEKWYKTCSWYFSKTGFYINKASSPILKKIVLSAFGTERDIQKNKVIIIDDKIMKDQMQRLFHCILDVEAIPYDIVHYLGVNASKPQTYTSDNYETVLSTACAVIRKYYNDIERKEVYKMELDENNHERSYLFGRLLAVGEMIERLTYDEKEEREPNAVRLQNVYVRIPFKTWDTIHRALEPYFEKLPKEYRKNYHDLIGEIKHKIEDIDAAKLNCPLDETYLLSYYLQRRELYIKKEYNGKNKEEN